MRFVFVLLTLLGCAFAQSNPVQRLNANELAAFFQSRVKEVTVLGLPGGALEEVLLEGLKQRQFIVSILLGKADAARGKRWAQAGARVGYLEGTLVGGVAVVNKSLLLLPQPGAWLMFSRPETVLQIEQLLRIAKP